MLNVSGYNIMSLFTVLFKVSPWSCDWWDCLSWFDLDSRHLMVVGIRNTVTIGCVMLWFFYLLYTNNTKHPFKQWFWSLSELVDIFLTVPCGFRILNSLNIPLSVETVCVFTAPIFSAFASWATYLLTKVCSCWNFTLISLLFMFFLTWAASFFRRLRVRGLGWQQQFFWLWWISQQALWLDEIVF